jgi:septal ring factor EnvC (AmiA/AmiB activator)
MESGARLGTVGQNGRATLLYFEIRRGTDCLDPAEWFGI